MEQEVWYDALGFEGYYQYSNLLRFKSVNRTVMTCLGKFKNYKEKILKVGFRKKDYPLVTFCKNDKKTSIHVHVFFATAFIPNPENKPCVNHDNGNKNDYSLANLKWATYSENAQHAYDNKLRVGLKGEKSPLYGKRGINAYAFGSKNGGARKVAIKGTNEVFGCIKDAANFLGVNFGSLRCSVSRNLKNCPIMYI